MADILKISTPLVEKMPVQATRSSVDPSIPFNLSDVTRVPQAADAQELLQQNTAYLAQDEGPKILADLLRDPAVTVGVIRNLYILQELIGLVPANNTALTEEIRQLFDMLMLSPGDMVAELARQDAGSTLFKGEAFDQLRGFLAQYGEAPDVATGVGVLLKGLNAAISRRDALDSVANNLAFLADSLAPSAQLGGKLQALSDAFRQADAIESFPALKQEALAVLKEVENSILFGPKLEKIVPLVVYNLSRFNDNEAFLPDALRMLLDSLPAEVDKMAFVDKLQHFLDKFIAPDGEGSAHAASLAQAPEGESRVMSALSRLIGRHTEAEDLALVSGDKIEKIVHSLLSSPSNFTPLLHFVLPVEAQDVRAFGEIWIDPNAGDGGAAGGGGGAADSLHMLMVFDVEGFGRFETELAVQGERLSMNLLCPPAHLEDFLEVGPAIRRAVAAIGYNFESINIGRLERTHSLMDVFTDLPHRRAGIDVKA